MTSGIPDVPYYVFDIDGTLTRYVDVDPSAFLHGNFLFPIVRDLMVERGADPDEAAAAILRETEANVYWDYCDLVSAFGLPAPEAYRRFRAWHAAHIAPWADAVALARELRRAGKRLFVVSNNPVTGCLLKLQAAGLADDTGSDVFSRLLGTNVLRGCKGAPGVWRRAFDRLGVDPALVCTVGDNPVEDRDLPRACGAGACYLFDRGRIERGIDGAGMAPSRQEELTLSPPTPSTLQPLQPMIEERLYRKKALGAWLGKAVGGTLGAPWEGCRGPLALTFYDPVPTDMVPNDDVDLQVVWACRLATDWRGVVSYANLSDAWQRNIGFALDEYGVAKRNLARGIPAPHSGAYDNAFTDGMGAAIRSEIWALLAPGDPATAARLARVDASVDHAGAGVHAEQFLAALESALFETSDLRAAIAAGLAQIPSGSRLARAIADTIRLCDGGGDFASVRAAILRDRGSENFTDVSMNLSFEVAALLLGGGDFARTVCLAVNFGRDADCTGATVGAILGILDPDAIPEEWLRPIGRSLVLNEGIAGIEPPPTLDALTDLIASLRDRISIDDAEPPSPDLSRFAIRCRRGLYRPWFAYDCRRTCPEKQPLSEEFLLPGNVSTVDFSGLPPESLLLLETDLDLPAAQDALLVVSTTADFRAWLDDEPVLGQECGPFVPAFHRTPANQRKALRLAAGVHKLRIGLAPAGEGMDSAPLAFGLAAPADSVWLSDSIYDHPGAVETGCASG